MNRGACVSKTGDLCDFHPDCPGGEDERLPMCCKFSFFLFSQCALSLFLPIIPRMRAMRKVMLTMKDIDVYPSELEVDMKLMNAAPVCYENEWYRDFPTDELEKMIYRCMEISHRWAWKNAPRLPLWLPEDFPSSSGKNCGKYFFFEILRHNLPPLLELSYKIFLAV